VLPVLSASFFIDSFFATSLCSTTDCNPTGSIYERNELLGVQQVALNGQTSSPFGMSQAYYRLLNLKFHYYFLKPGLHLTAKSTVPAKKLPIVHRVKTFILFYGFLRFSPEPEKSNTRRQK
jgi:hypothetical protein